MRWFACVAPLILLASGACDNKQDAGGAKGAGSSTTPSTGPATADAGEDAAPKPAATVAMPERPVPRPQTMVGSGMSIEVQQKAIAYMVAMRAPHPDDVAA